MLYQENYNTVPEAFDRLKELANTVRFKVEGGDANGFLVSNKNPNIKLLGKCSDMRKVYNKMDIVILPSWREGLSKALLESAAMSLPIITTNVPGCKDIIDNNYSGLLVPVRNEEKLKFAIKKYLDNPEIAIKYGENARKTVCSKFTIQIINKKILKIYEEFLNIDK